MELAGAVTMDRQEAADAAADYREIAAPSAEERAILAGYLALAAGKKVIRLSEAIASGGHDDKGWPRLAAMRADKRWCHLRVATIQSTSSVVWTFQPQRFTDGRSRAAQYRIEAPMPNHIASCYGDYRAMVPIIPPRLRPRWRGRAMLLSGFVILWEVPEWELAPRPPGDPALLRPLEGDLYTVEAMWDLTPLEQAVLSGRSS